VVRGAPDTDILLSLVCPRRTLGAVYTESVSSLSNRCGFKLSQPCEEKTRMVPAKIRTKLGVNRACMDKETAVCSFGSSCAAALHNLAGHRKFP
jgi:hypothetical protein